MTYLFSTLFWWMLLALVLGGAVGFMTWSQDKNDGWAKSWLKWALVAFIVGLIIAVLHLFRGRFGFWLESALFLFASYIIGCFLGAWFKGSQNSKAGVGAAALGAGSTAAAADVAASAGAGVTSAAAAAKAASDKMASDKVAADKAVADKLAADQAAAKAAADKAAEDKLAADAAAHAAAANATVSTGASATAGTGISSAMSVAGAGAAAIASGVISTGAAHPGVKPVGVASPEGGVADDLKQIKGIGPKNEKILNGLGVYHFCQIGAWTPENATWMGHHMAFPGRIEREHWISQANLLCAGLDTEHSKGVKSGAIVVDESADAPLSEADAAALHAGMPQVMAPVEGEGEHAGQRPLGLAAPRGGKSDDLKLIKGIGKQNEARLHGLGIWHFDQIAAWTHEQVLWVGSYLAFPGRIDREQWIAQSKVLAAGGTTEFAQRVERGEVASSMDDGSHGVNNVAKVDPKH